MANVMDNVTDWMQSRIGPIATKLGQNRVLKAISEGMMLSSPITIGVALIAILINLPIPGLADAMAASGFVAAGNEVIGATMSLMAIYISFLIAYQYAKEDGMNPITAGVMSMGSLLILVPSTIQMGDDTTISAFKSNYLGSDGIFVAIVLAIVVAAAYGWLTRKNIKLKLPESVPPMVADSLSPVFVAMIIFTTMFFIKWGFTLTPFGNIFALVSTVISTPLKGLTASPWTPMIVFTLANLFWFFGIHPNAILSMYFPLAMPLNMENMNAFMAGEPLPHLMFALANIFIYFGGQGNTICLCLDMFTAKSEKFKAMRGLMTIPNLFNINEPVIFGVPVMLNPIFFIPMVLSCIVPGLVGMGLASILPVSLNPTIQMPWITPAPITALVQGGPVLLGILLVCIAVTCLLYYPFFKIADNQAYEEEQAFAAEQAE